MKLRKNLSLVLALVLGLVLLAGCGGKDAGSTKSETKEAEKPAVENTVTMDTMKPITLKFADFLPEANPVSKNIMQFWVKRVGEITNGKVKVDYYPAGTLLKSGDMYDGVASGQADVGSDVAGYNIGRLPVLNAMYVGGIEYRGARTSTSVARDIVKEFKPKELSDTQPMFIYGVSPGVLMTTKPVRTLEDLKGMQIRASGANVDTLKALGAVPVGITVSETYDSMSKGVVEGALLPPEILVAFKLGEVTKYVSQVDMLYNTVNYVTMNKKVWDSLPKDAQDAINKVNDEVYEIMTKLWEGKDGINQKGLDFAVSKGNEIITISDEEAARWLEKLKPLPDEYAKKLDSQGIDGKAVMNRIKELTKKYNDEFYPKK